MKNLITILAASALIAGSLTSCVSAESPSEIEISSESKVSSENESENTESANSTETSAEEASSKDESPEDSYGIEESCVFGDIPFSAPEDIVPDEATDTDFVGKWGCSRIVDESGVLSGELNGVPIEVMLEMIVNGDGTGQLGSAIGSNYEGSLDFEWTFEEDHLTMTTPGDDAPAYAYLENGELVFTDAESIELYYFKKVDDFLDFDFDAAFGSYEDTEESPE